MAVFDSMRQLADIHPTIGLLVIIPFVLFYAYLMSNRKNWMKFEIFLGICIAATFPVSNYIMSVWIHTEVDALTKVLFYFVLLGMMAPVVTFYRARNTKDDIIVTSLSITNLLARGGLLFAAGYALKNVQGFSPLALKADCALMAILMVSDFMHVKKLPLKNGRLKRNGEVSKNCVYLDTIFALFIALLLLGFPRTIGEIIVRGTEVSSVHIMLMKSLGCQMLASALLIYASLHFKDKNESAYVFQTKFVVYMPMLALSYWRVLTCGPSQTDWSLVVIVLFSAFLVINASLGQYLNPKRFGDVGDDEDEDDRNDE